MDNEIWIDNDNFLWCVNDNYLWIPRFENGREIFILKNINYRFDSENIDYSFTYIDPAYENNYTI